MRRSASGGRSLFSIDACPSPSKARTAPPARRIDRKFVVNSSDAPSAASHSPADKHRPTTARGGTRAMAIATPSASEQHQNGCRRKLPRPSCQCHHQVIQIGGDARADLRVGGDRNHINAQPSGNQRGHNDNQNPAGNNRHRNPGAMRLSHDQTSSCAQDWRHQRGNNHRPNHSSRRIAENAVGCDDRRKKKQYEESHQIRLPTLPLKE